MDSIGLTVKGFEKRLEHRQKHPENRSTELFYKAMVKYYRMIHEASADGRPIAWLGALSPVEIFYAMNIAPFMPEMHVGIVTSQTSPMVYLDTAAGYGMPVELCSAHRAMMGMYLKEELPAPSLLVNTSQVCDSGIKSFESLHVHCQVPAFFLDQPRLINKEGLIYYKKEIEKLIGFLEEHTGIKMDYGRLEEVIHLSAQAHQLLYEIGEMRKTIPTPMRGREIFRIFSLFKMLAGTKEAVECLQATRDEVEELVRKGQGAAKPERYRLYWAYVIPNYALPLFDWMEVEHGAVIVKDLFSHVPEETPDPSRPLESLAEKGLNILTRQLGGPVEYTIEDILTWAKDYRLDGVVFIAHIGCKHGCALTRSLKDALRKEANIPMLIIDGDTIDPSVISMDSLKSKLEAFFEMLD